MDGTEITTGIRTGVQALHKTVCPVCKEFLGLLPKILYHSFLYISIGCEHTDFEGFLLWSEDDIVIS